MIVSPFILFLTMIGIIVVAPTTATTVTREVTKRAGAFKNSLKYESKLRKAAKSEEKSKTKIKSYAKKYYKSMKLSSRKVFPTYDNLSVDNFSSKKVNKVEGKRNKLIANIGLAKINGKTAKVEKLTNQLVNNYGVRNEQTPYNYVEKIKIDDSSDFVMELRNNSISCNLESTRDAFKNYVEQTPYKKGSTYPYVTKVLKNDTEFSSLATTSNDIRADILQDFLVDAYVDSLMNEKTDFPPSYSLITFDSDPKRNSSKTHQETVFNNSDEILNFAISQRLFKNPEQFYDKAKEIAKEKDVTVKINGKFVKSSKDKQVDDHKKQEEKLKKLYEEEKIVCESEKTKQQFEESLTRKDFAPKPQYKDFKVSIKLNDTETYTLKSQSKARATTFTFNLLMETYRKFINVELAFDDKYQTLVATFENSYKEKNPDGKGFDNLNSNIIFKSSQEVKAYILDKFEVNEADFNKKYQELDKELTVKETLFEH